MTSLYDHSHHSYSPPLSPKTYPLSVPPKAGQQANSACWIVDVSSTLLQTTRSYTRTSVISDLEVWLTSRLLVSWGNQSNIDWILNGDDWKNGSESQAWSIIFLGTIWKAFQTFSLVAKSTVCLFFCLSGEGLDLRHTEDFHWVHVMRYLFAPVHKERGQTSEGVTLEYLLKWVSVVL